MRGMELPSEGLPVNDGGSLMAMPGDAIVRTKSELNLAKAWKMWKIWK